MRNVIFVISNLLIGGCSLTPNLIEPDIKTSDVRLMPYVDRFFEESESRGLSFSKENLIFTIRSQQTTGWFETYNSGKSYIFIDSTFFSNYTSFDNLMPIEAIVFHELGHALLGRDHIEEYRSLMNAKVCTTCYTEETKNKFIDELFLYTSGQ